MTELELRKLFEENYLNCPPFVFRYRNGAGYCRWQFALDLQSSFFHCRPMWTSDDFHESFEEMLNLLLKPDALVDDQPFERWLLSWTSGVQLDTSQVEELL